MPLEPADWEPWLRGSIEEALQLVKVPPCELIAHAAADPAKQVPLPIAVANAFAPEA